MVSPQIENGHLDIANELVDALMKTQLSGYQSRFLWALWRKTYSWHKKEDWISDSQLIEMTGLRKQHIWRTKQELIKRNIVTKNGYKIAFQKDYMLWVELPKMVTVTKNGYYEAKDKVTKIGTEVTKIGGHKRNYTKETYIKDIIPKNRKHTFNEKEDLLPEDILELKSKFPTINVDFELEKAKDWIAANGKQMIIYKAFFRNWMRNSKSIINVTKGFKDYGHKIK